MLKITTITIPGDLLLIALTVGLLGALTILGLIVCGMTALLVVLAT